MEDVVNARRVRKNRAAAYRVCRSEREVDALFDSLAEMMLSERREDYFWGVLIDLAPSTLFRTLGDYEIEERVRFRFERICADYGSCGFFAILRGRRYCGNGEFRCEDGIYGALRLLASGHGNGCSLRLSTEDTVERSDRIFVWDAGGSCGFPLLPCDITRSSHGDGNVAIACGGGKTAAVRKSFLRGLDGVFVENYRVIGWVTFPIDPVGGVTVYRTFAPEKRLWRTCMGKNNCDMGDKAVCYAKRLFLEGINSERGGFDYGGNLSERIARIAAALFGYTALAEMEAIDAVNLAENLRSLLDRTELALSHSTEGSEGSEGSDGSDGSEGSEGFLRIALLVTAAFCDGMGGSDEAFYSVASRMRGYAECLRAEFESGRCCLSAPFLPCEMVAFHVSGDGERSFFGGFTAPRRVCDRFLYLFSLNGERLQGILLELLSGGFGEYGVDRGGEDAWVLNALLISVCAERRRGTFSRIAAIVPELRACRALFYALP